MPAKAIEVWRELELEFKDLSDPSESMFVDWSSTDGWSPLIRGNAGNQVNTRFNALATRAGLHVDPQAHNPRDTWLNMLHSTCGEYRETNVTEVTTKVGVLIGVQRARFGSLHRLRKSSVTLCGTLRAQAATRRQKFNLETDAQRAARREAIVGPILKANGLSVYRWEKNAGVTSKVAQRYLNGTTKALHPDSRKLLSDLLGIQLPD